MSTVQYNLWLDKDFLLTPIELKAVINNRKLFFRALGEKLHGDPTRWEILQDTPVKGSPLTLGEICTKFME